MKRRLATIVLILVVLLTGCKKDNHLATVGVCPLVVSTIPVDKAVNVPLNQVISATFNEMMKTATITSSSFTVTGPTTAGVKAATVTGTITYSGTTVTTATLTPASPLLPNTTYTGRVTTAVKDLINQSLQADYVWTFTTGVSPTVISTDPINTAMGVVLNKIVTATFSVPMDPLTITATTFTLNQGTTVIPGAITYTGSTASFTPASALIPNTVYTGTITTGASNLIGTPLANNYVWTFTTGVSPTVISTDPVNTATGIVLDKVVAATFSVPMDPLTLTATTFTLNQGTTAIPGTITYSGSTVSFTPTIALAPNTLYTGTITTGAKNVAGIPLASNYVWTFTTGISPTVQSTDPANNATAVALNKVITATFSVPMDPLTLVTPATNFTVRQASTVIPGTVSYSGSTASFTPTVALTPNTIYTGTIATGAKNVAGIPLESNYVWTFTTIGIAPTVSSTDPVNNATGVVLNKVVAATFSVPMDPLTLTTPATNFTVKQGTTVIPGTVSYSGSTAFFTPTVALTPNTVYTGTIATGAKNAAGTPLASDYVWTFTTGISPTVQSTDPANNATAVALNKVITATFSVPMDPLTLTTPATNFTVKQGTTVIPGTVSYSGSTASFTPTAALTPNTVYTGTIATGAKNAAGTPLASNYVWTFTTVAIAPTVNSTDPVNNATGVVLNKVVAATFSVPLDPLTVNGTNFNVKQGTTVIPGTVSYSGSTASFTPTVAFTPNTVYTGTVTTGVKNVAGTPLAADYVWTFTTVAAVAPTVASIDPVNNATGELLNKVIAVTFSTPMDPLTIATPATNVTVKQGSTVIPGTVSYSGSTATFTPTAALTANTVYTVTVTTGAKNVAGTALAADFISTFTTAATPFSPVVDLKTAGRFGILANTTVTNNAGASVINNQDVGISAGARSSVTGFPPATIIGGAMYCADDAPPTPAMLTQAKQDLTDAYLFAEAATTPAPVVTLTGDQGGKTLTPGIYKSTSTLLIQFGNLTLDGQGDPNATWIFQVTSDFTTVGGAGGSIVLAGNASAKNVFWQVGSSAVIGDNTIFYGNVLALTSITLNANAVATGRMLARNGAVIMTSTNIINKP